jgi:hypothetical protein
MKPNLNEQDQMRMLFRLAVAFFKVHGIDHESEYRTSVRAADELMKAPRTELQLIKGGKEND